MPDDRLISTRKVQSFTVPREAFRHDVAAERAFPAALWIINVAALVALVAIFALITEPWEVIRASLPAD